MINSLSITILLLFLYITYRIRNNRRQEIKFRYRIHKLQRRLNNLAKNNYVDANSQEYDYLHMTLTLYIEKSNPISFFNMLVLEYKHRRIAKDIRLYRKIYSRALKRIESNLYLYEINEARIAIFTEYLIGKNKITWSLIGMFFAVFSHSNRVKQFIRNRVVCYSYLPETSAIRRFLVVASKTRQHASAL